MTAAKWLILIFALYFLGLKLKQFDEWQELSDSLWPLSNKKAALLITSLLLMPLNWSLDAKKWQMLLKKETRISFINAVQSVLGGLVTGFLSPNRVAEFAGRILYLPPQHRVSGTVLSFVNSLTQNLIISSLGIIAGLIYLSKHSLPFESSRYLLITAVSILLLVVLVFSLPSVSRRLQASKLSKNLKAAFKSLSAFTVSEFIAILGITTLRYLVFNLQFILLLHFFGVHIPWQQAITGTAFMYLLITFTPSFSAAEPAIRSSLAVLIFSVFTPNSAAVLLAGISIWIINYAIPMLFGLLSLFLKKDKKRESSETPPWQGD